MSENRVDHWSRELGGMLVDRSWRVAVAESCTGGLVGSAITDVPGSSAYFAGGVIAYSNEAKTKLLGVSERTISDCGAVSEAVASQMAAGCQTLLGLGVEVGVATTGIAGPGGGTEAKPVGLVYVAVAIKGDVAVRSYRWNGSRIQNKQSTVEAALRLAVEMMAAGPR
ncbi:CinA family protein [Candidatus Bipolaricaulota bacterium]|nr:CinA family protein [Candidatus Bipolaricaulota bacterium]